MLRASRSLSSMRQPSIKLFVADWDDTIVNDTIHLVAQAAYQTHPDFPYPWDHFKRIYMDSYTRYTSTTPNRLTVEDEWKYQRGLKDVELSSVNEYVRVGLFKGVTRETMEAQAARVIIKPEAMETLRALYDMNIPIRILSVNWTSVIMKKVLEMNGIHVDGDMLKIYTNELEERDGVFTGEVSEGEIRTGVDKERVIQHIRSEIGVQDGLWYIGDSSTDLFSLLSADKGIVFGDGSALSTVKKYSIPYDTGLGGEQKVKYIKNWTEILEVIKSKEAKN